MTKQRFNKAESLNRILRLLQGNAIPTDTPNAVTGDVLSEDEAFSNIAELLAGSLPNQSARFPSSLLPSYGGIYTYTGTTAMTGIPVTWTKITGTFRNSMLFSDENITCQPTQDRLLINDYGIYEVSWSMSFYGSPAVDYFIEPYCSVAMPQASVLVRPSASGSAVSVAGSGIVYASGSAVQVSLYVRPSATAWLITSATQLHVKRVEKK